MPTNREILSANYPDQFERIEQLSPHNWLGRESELDPSVALHSAFIWADTTEGHAFWKALADKPK